MWHDYEDEQMDDVEANEENASNSNNSGESDDNFEESENAGEDEDENEEVVQDPSPFINLDVSTIKSEQYTILRHINQFRLPGNTTVSFFHTKFQQDVYRIIYAKKMFANHRFVI